MSASDQIDALRYAMMNLRHGKTALMEMVKERDAALKERDEALCVLRDLLEQKGVRSFRETLVRELANAAERLARAPQSSHLWAEQDGVHMGLTSALKWLDEETAGALKPAAPQAPGATGCIHPSVVDRGAEPGWRCESCGETMLLPPRWPR